LTDNDTKRAPAPDNSIRICGRNFDKRILAAIFLFCLITIFLVQNIIFIKMDSRPITADNHLFRTLLYYDNIFLGGKTVLKEHPYPPLFYLLPQPFYRIFGVSMESARIAVTILSIIFILAMFGIGYEMGGYYSGAAVAAIAASSPLVLKISRLYFPDFPQTALTALCFYLLLKSNFFKNRLFTFLFWMTMTLSFLTKWATAFYMFIPVLWFLIPGIFKSKRSFLTFLGFLIPAGVYVIGTSWFYKNIGGTIQENQWFSSYIMFVILPAIVCIGLMLFLDKLFRSDKNYINSATYGIVNFSIFSAMFASLTSPWFFWASWALKSKFLVDMQTSRNLVFNFEQMMEVLLFMYGLLPAFILTGLVFMFIFRKDMYKKLVIPINIIIVFVLMLKFGFSSFRYLLSFIIFLAALGGFWVCHTGKLKTFFTSIIVILSLISMLAWTFIPESIDIYTGVKFLPVMIIRSVAPRSVSFDLSELINEIRPAKGRKWKFIIMLEVGNLPFELEFFQEEAFKRGKKVEALFYWRKTRNFDKLQNEISNISAGSHLLSEEDIDDRMISRLKSDNSSLSRHVMGRLPTDTRKRIEEYEAAGPTSGDLQKSLTMELNRIMQGPCLYNENRFSKVDLSSETRKFIRQNPRGINRERLNRLLLQEAYPHEILISDYTNLWKELNSVDDIIIFHRKDQNVKPLVDMLLGIFPDISYRIKTFDPGGKYRATLIKLER